MSRKDDRPSRAFSLLYLATQELDVSLSSATASATLGSVFSLVMVALTLLMTSSVSFTYSSSEAAHADVTGSRNAGERIPAVNERKFLRPADKVVEAVAVAAAMVVVGLVSLDLMGVSGFGVEVVGVMRVGEAMEMGRRKEVDEREREREMGGFWKWRYRGNREGLQAALKQSLDARQRTNLTDKETILSRQRTNLTDKPLMLEVTKKPKSSSREDLLQVGSNGYSRFVVLGTLSVGFVLFLMGVDDHKALAFGPEGPLMEDFWDNMRRYGLYALTISRSQTAGFAQTEGKPSGLERFYPA
ncbi:hypothetical protein RJ640_015734 [Escallonia rubra]|uniref:Uncharacterized protein n=1 Tax=Escallonia rubra TaxID=112253 RepID=A0AA88UPJ4_9ASTE|nr:hypothetical protein RJ640_015734 [Escallonia rubra]